MTESSIPQQGLLVGDASLAPYSADAFALYMSKQIGYGASRDNYGIIRGNNASPSSNVTFYGLDVRAPGTTAITLKSGTAVVKGTLYENTADLSFTVAANASGNPRIDTLILRKDYVAQTVRAVLKQGTAAASPVPPSLTQSAGTTWEIPIADIAVANGFVSISQSNITPRHGYANEVDRVVLDQVKNVSGGELVTGDVVVFAVNASIEQLEANTTTTQNEPTVGGVWIGRTANNGYGRVLVRGLGLVNLGSSALGGDILITHTVAKQAATGIGSAYWGMNQLGRLVDSSGTTGLRLAYINPRANRLDYARVIDLETQNTAGGTFTSGAWRTRVLNAIRTTQTGGSNQFFTPTPASNVIVLPAGFFLVRASAPAYNCDGHQTRLNIGSGSNFVYGTSEYAPTGVQTRSFVEAVLSSGVSFTLEHRCVTTRATDGLGKPSNLENEVYAVVEIYKLPLMGW